MGVDTADKDICGCLARAIEAHRQGRTDAAVAAYRAVITDCGDSPGDRRLSGVAHANLGALLLDRGHWQPAGEYLRRAVSLVPELPEPHFNMGRISEMTEDLPAAISRYREAHARAPHQPKFLSQLVHAQQKCCDWDDLELRCRQLDRLNQQALASGRPVAESPFKSISRTDDPATNLAVARWWSTVISRRAGTFTDSLPPRPPRAPSEAIIIGYLSDRFRNAATGHQVCSIFGLHDRRRFRVHTYSYGPDDGSDYRRRIAADSDRFVDVSRLDDAAAARLIRSQGVDILVDLKGHTHNHRLGISALRPAPVQATWLGFPGPTGADFFDYVICDRTVVPDADIEHFTECPVRLPHTYYPTDFRQPVDREGAGRADHGLPEEAFVFCSFNQNFKIDPQLFDYWMAILRNTPGSVLWLPDSGAAALGNLRREATRRKVSPERLVFAKQLAKAQHLARLGLADLCLDTRIYNGHTTTADALWVGVPVVTLKGRHFASRVSASLLTALGLPELIARDLDGYRELARFLASDAGARTDLRRRIVENRHRLPLFDTPRFVRHLEAAYQGMWGIVRRKEPPRPFDVEERTP